MIKKVCGSAISYNHSVITIPWHLVTVHKKDSNELTACLLVYSMLADDLKLSSDDEDTQRVGNTRHCSLKPRKQITMFQSAFNIILLY